MSARAAARWIEAVAWLFVAMGALLPFAFEWPAFASYRETLAQRAFGLAVIPPEDTRLLGLMLGILGGSIAGKWIVHALVARGPLAEGRAWARNLTAVGLAAWCLVDSIASALLGASFNIWMINVVPFVLVGLPLVLSWNRFTPSPVAASGSPAALACFWTAVFGASTGIGIAFGGTTPLFHMWFRGLESAHYAGASLEDPARRLALFFFGPIGGCTFAQFVMLAALVRSEAATLRTALAGLLSIAAWFLIDSGYGLLYAGLFNIVLVNLPAVAMTLPPWAVLAYERVRDD